MFARNQTQQKAHLAVADALSVLLAMVSALVLRFKIDAQTLGFKDAAAPWEEYLVAAIPIIAITLFCFRANGLYRLDRSRTSELLSVLQSAAVAVMVMLSVTFFYRGYSFSRATALLFYPLTVGYVTLSRHLYRRYRERLFGRRPVVRRVLIVGAGTVGTYLLQQIKMRPSFYQPIGFLDDDPRKIGRRIEGLEVIGSVDSLEAVAAAYGIDEVIVAFPSAPHEKIMEVLERCLVLKVAWKVVPDLYDLMLDRLRIDSVGQVPLLGMKSSNIMGFNYAMKRTVDLAVSGGLLALLGLPMLLVAALVRLTSRGRALYRQARVGYHGAEFELLKFRTMYVGNDATIHEEYAKLWIEGRTGVGSGGNGSIAPRTVGGGNGTNGSGRPGVHKIVKDPRVTPIGRLLRKFSLDELPQLLNVVRGDMSLVGPRPPIPYEVRQYKEWHKRRFEAHPGITGLWQVAGRNRLSFEEMVRLDVEYIENWSIEMDARIFIKTIPVVIFGRAY